MVERVGSRVVERQAFGRRDWGLKPPTAVKDK